MVEKTIYQGLVNLQVIGDNFKRDRSKRHWEGKSTGGSRTSASGEIMIEVTEVTPDGRTKKWLNLQTFTGSVGKYRFIEGRRVDNEVSEHDW